MTSSISIYIIGLMLFLSLIKESMSMKFFDNYDGDYFVGPTDSGITSFLELTNDPVGNLPPSFTVCSSLFMRYFIPVISFGDFYQDDGSYWFNFEFGFRVSYKTFELEFSLMYDNKNHFHGNTTLLAIPHSWYHACIGIDTTSGLVQIVVNGKTILQQEISYFSESVIKRPRTLAGNFQVFRVKWPSVVWRQGRSIFGNMNVYKVRNRRMITKNKVCH